MTTGEYCRQGEELKLRDMRGQISRAKYQTLDSEVREFLRERVTANAGTVGVNGWPHVVPLVYIYDEGDFLYLHTGHIKATSSCWVYLSEPGIHQVRI